MGFAAFTQSSVTSDSNPTQRAWTIISYGSLFAFKMSVAVLARLDPLVFGQHGAMVAPLPERIDAFNFSLDSWTFAPWRSAWCPMAAPTDAGVWVLVCTMYLPKICGAWAARSSCLHEMWAISDVSHPRGGWGSLGCPGMKVCDVSRLYVCLTVLDYILGHIACWWMIRWWLCGYYVLEKMNWCALGCFTLGSLGCSLDGNWSWFGSVCSVLFLFLFVVLFLLVGLVWLWFCVGFVVLHDLSHSLSSSHKRCEVLHLSQWKGTGLALATYVTSARRRYISFSYGTACIREIRRSLWGKKNMIWSVLAMLPSPLCSWLKGALPGILPKQHRPKKNLRACPSKAQARRSPSESYSWTVTQSEKSEISNERRLSQQKYCVQGIWELMLD